MKHGSISSKDELTKIDMRSLFEDIAGNDVEIVFMVLKYGFVKT